MTIYRMTDDTTVTRIMHEHGDAPGVYRLVLLNAEGELQPIERLFGADPGGTLQIGTGAILHERIGTLRKGVLAAYGIRYSTPDIHQCGAKIASRPRFREIFVAEQLGITIELYVRAADASKYDSHMTMEGDLIREYGRLFGEIPPLNG